jgi:hypothetical protein
LYHKALKFMKISIIKKNNLILVSKKIDL